VLIDGGTHESGLGGMLDSAKAIVDPKKLAVETDERRVFACILHKIRAPVGVKSCTMVRHVFVIKQNRTQ
jgi:hypothetical protein